jgi:hypothetical protein
MPAELTETVARCGWCGAYEDELEDPTGPCPQALDYDPETGEPYIMGPHQFIETQEASSDG